MKDIAGLYVIIDPAACRGREPVAIARAALAGGASAIQWRDKQRDKGEQLAAARAIRDLCRQHDAVFIINDHVDLMLALAAEDGAGAESLGVHVGQKDLPLEDVRRILRGAPFVVGVSTNNPDEAANAQRNGASYVAVGDIFGTTSKQGTRAASPKRLAEVRAAVTLPVIGIGGINRSNVGQVMAAGASGVAVISAVCSAEDPEAAAHELIAAMKA